MDKNSNRIVITCVVVALIILAGYTYAGQHGKRADFKKLQDTIAGYAQTSSDRVGKSVITLPDGNTLVGLVNGYAQYDAPASAHVAAGTVTVFLNNEATEFIPGSFETANPPRLDVAAPMFVSGDVNNGSTYIVLFNDHGDAAIEKSYARLGGSDIAVSHIGMLVADNPEYEYRVDVLYTQQGQEQGTGKLVSNTKEVILPVLDGHFDPKGAVELK